MAWIMLAALLCGSLFIIFSILEQKETYKKVMLILGFLILWGVGIPLLGNSISHSRTPEQWEEWHDKCVSDCRYAWKGVFDNSSGLNACLEHCDAIHRSSIDDYSRDAKPDLAHSDSTSSAAPEPKPLSCDDPDVLYRLKINKNLQRIYDIQKTSDGIVAINCKASAVTDFSSDYKQGDIVLFYVVSRDSQTGQITVD